MSTSVLKALPGKLDVKRHSPSILYFPGHTHDAPSTAIRNHESTMAAIDSCCATFTLVLPL